MSRIPRVPTAIITTAALLAAGLAVATITRTADAAEQTPFLRVASRLTGDPAYRSAMDSAGRWVAFEANSTGGPSYLSLRDMQSPGSPNEKLPLGDVSATMPTMDGDARVIGYVGDRPDAQPSDPQDPQIYAFDRNDPDHPVVRAVTNTPNDLPYQRMMTCPINTGDGDAKDCAPKLSGDGRTMVAPVIQSIESGQLDVGIDGEGWQTDRGLYPVLNFGAFATAGTIEVELTNTGQQAIVYPDTGPIVDGDSAFTVGENTCAATLQPNATCFTKVVFRANADCTDEANAVLRFQSTNSAAGQTAFKLTGGGECPRLVAFPPRPAAAAAADPSCTGPSEYTGNLPIADDPHEGSEGRLGPWFSIGAVAAGELTIDALTIRNSMASEHVPTLTSVGCALKLVKPAGATDACTPDQPIPPQSSCTAYVESRLPAVGPFSARIQVGDTAYSIGGHATQQVIAAWRDQSVTGSFGKASIVSVTGPDGVSMDGSGPAVSYDGRWVAFVSDTALGRPATDPNSAQAQSQIYLHDTDVSNDRTYQPGATTLVSVKTDGTLPYTATEPSVSQNGDRVAFTSWEPNGSPTQDHYLQVYVRDLPTKKSVLASAGPDGSSANEWTDQSQLSADGSTVVYQSSATNLGVGALPGDRIIARDLTKDFAGGRGTNELISVRPSGPGSSSGDRFAAVSPEGTNVVFTSTDSMDTDDPDTTSDVYLAQRRTHLTVTPNPLDFGSARVGTTVAARPITVTNAGQAAVRMGLVQEFKTKDFKLTSDQCGELTLHPGDSCVYLVEFTPQAVGQRRDSTFVSVGGALNDMPYLDVQGIGAGDSRTPGETTHVSTNDGVHTDPAISDNGQYVAYRTSGTGADDWPTQIDVRNRATQDVSTLGKHGSVGPPAISGDGSRVAYTAANNKTVQTVVADSKGTHLLSGTSADLRYQRPAECSYRQDSSGSSSGSFSRQCRPDISGDGKTVAFGARLDPAANWLDLNFEFPAGQSQQVGSIIDLGRGGTGTLTVRPDRDIVFASKPAVDPGSGFSVTGTTCDGSVQSNGTCTIDVKYSACAGPGLGVLRLPGATPEGQTAISLVANGTCVGFTGQPAVKAAADCAPMQPATYEPYISTATTNLGNPLADAGEWPVGTQSIVALEVTAQPGEQTIAFGSGCDFAIVGATNPNPNLPKPCVNGERLPANTGCIAYVGYRPGAPDVSAAWMRVNGTGPEKVYRFTGHGYQDVILTRADTKGDGTFAGAPEIASKTSAGETMDGSEPSLSADGRYVAYGSRNGETQQIYRHDRIGGQTILVSQLPNGQPGPVDAIAPSLSATGDRVAFGTLGHRSEGVAAKGGARSVADVFPGAVYARDISTGKTIVVSAAMDKPGVLSDGWADEPSMSDDGSTVGFRSDGADLVTESGNDAAAVYVRFVEPEFSGSATTFNERVSLTAEGTVPADGRSTSPSLSADGAFTAFDSQSRLVPTDTDDDDDVYVRRRLPQLVVSPASADFGAVPVGKSSSARAMVVQNLGNGPVTAGPTSVPQPFVAGSNLCTQTLHRGESCTIDARFAPTTAGRAGGLMTLPSKQGYLTGSSVTVGLTGSGTGAARVARWSVAPGSLVFPSTALGKAAPAASVKVLNTGDVPLNVAAAVTGGGGDFAATLGACATVMPGAGCDVPVTFSPRKAGTRSGGLVLTPRSGDPAVPSPRAATVALSGVGVSTPGQPVASMQVAPQRLAFGPQILATASAPQSIVVANTGTVPLRLMAVASVPDFVPAAACGLVQPGQSCAIPVRFAPTAIGARMDVIRVVAAAVGAVSPYWVPVVVTGTAPTPTLTADPPVTRPGQIVVATGANFPPGRPVVVTWDLGLGAQPVVADKTGKFTTAMLVFRRDSLGQRLLNGTVPGLAAPVRSTPVLVLPLSYQPPNFVLRW